MEHNPYQPPLTPVDDVVPGAERVRPLAVKIAVGILFLGLMVDLAYLLPIFDAMMRGELSPLRFASRLLGYGIAVWIYVKIYSGRNWARIALLVIYVVIIGVLLFAFRDALHLATLALLWPMFLRPALNVVALILLFGPGRAWFAPR